MPINITLEDRTNTVHGSDHSDHSDHSSSSSRTDDEDSTGTGVNLRQASSGQGHDYSDPADEQDGSWLSDSYPEDIGSSDSASRPRISHQKRQFVEAPQPVEARRPSFRRHISREPVRHLPHPRAHRSEPSDPPESVDSHDEWQGYARGQPQLYSRPYAHYTSGYPSPHAYQTYPAPSAIPGGLQQMVPYGFPPYQTPTAGPAPSYFAHGHHGGPSHEMIPHASSAGYLPYTSQGYPMPMPVPMSPPVAYPAYGGMYPHPPTPSAPSAPPAQPTPAVTTPPPPPSASDTSKEDEKYARLEKLLLDQEAKQLEREAAVEEAAKAKIAKAEAEAKKAEEISKASAAAATAAREEVVKQYQAAEKDKAAKAEAEAQKAEEIAKASASAAAAAREEVEKEHQAAAEANKEKAAAAAAAAAAKPPAPPKEKDKPIKFKDAIGRRFNFPFDVCNTWSGMEYLIKEAFLHVADLGPHVAGGQYDLLGPKDEIIMPSIWESVIEPGWEITMHMWPIPEPPEGGDALAGGMADVVIVEPGLPPPPPGGNIIDEKKDKKKKKAPIPPFMRWTAGKSKQGRGTAKSKKK